MSLNYFPETVEGTFNETMKYHEYEPSNIRNTILPELVTNKWINLQSMHFQDGDLCALCTKSKVLTTYIFVFKESQHRILIVFGVAIMCRIDIDVNTDPETMNFFPFCKILPQDI